MTIRDSSVTTLLLKVSASADDAHETGGGTNSINGLNFESDHTAEWHAFRWQNVTIGQGETINSAILKVYIDNGLGDEPDHTLWGIAEDNVAAFAANHAAISSYAKTTASVAWSSADLGAASNQVAAWGAASAGGTGGSNVGSIVQEIVNRAGWASGNALGMADTSRIGTTSRDLNITFYDENSAHGAELEIDYTGSGGGATAPAFRLSLLGVGR